VSADSGYDVPFLGPGGENFDWFGRAVAKLVDAARTQRAAFRPDVLSDARLPGRNPALGIDLIVLARELGDRMRLSTPFTSPAYLGHMNSDVSPAAILGSIAAVLSNPNLVVRESSPAVFDLETEVIGALLEMIGFPRERGWGYLLSGGTLANLDAIVRARRLKEVVLELGEAGALSADEAREALVAWRPERVLEAYEAYRGQHASAGSRPRLWRPSFVWTDPQASGVPGVVLAPSTSHHSIEKGVDIAGIGTRRMVYVPVDSRCRLDVMALRTILRDLARQRIPVIALVVNVATTEEGAVDPIDEVVDVVREMEARHGLACYLHADAALGGYLRLLRKDPSPAAADGSATGTAALGADVTRALEAMPDVDSVTVDPHKWGFVPYGAGAILYRDRRMAGLNSAYAPYLWPGQSPTSTGAFTIEGSRPGERVLSVWSAQRLCPLTPERHGRLIAGGVRNARRLAELLEAAGPVEAHGHRAHFRVLMPPDSCIVTFMCVPEGAGLADCNALNRLLAVRYRYDGSRPRDTVDYIASSTDLDVERYGDAVSRVLERVGVDHRGSPAEGGPLKVLRCTIIHPWDISAALEGFTRSLREAVGNLMQLIPLMRAVAVETGQEQRTT
jgi:glutamate/tyrosine decarboxylase-like PLP-dependent enzyme